MKAEASGALAALQNAVELERSQMTLGSGSRGARTKARAPTAPHLPGFLPLSCSFGDDLLLILLHSKGFGGFPSLGMHPTPQYDDDDDEDGRCVAMFAVILRWSCGF